ncbi:MAG: hypothetical protein AB1Z67_05740 [Candidatus Limnocylindrales bacterium]
MIMTMIPVLIVFLLFQRFFVSGAFSGAVTGRARQADEALG